MEKSSFSAAMTTKEKTSNVVLTARLVDKLRRISKEPEIEEDLVPEVQRRFQFNMEAIASGKSMNDLFNDELPPEEDFNKIVDWDENRVENYVSTYLVGELLEHSIFKNTITALIVMNTFLIAIATDEDLSERYSTIFSIFEQFVTMFFACEILLKWYHNFWLFWKTGWNIFDFVILVTLLLGPSMTFLGTGRILRILRIVRAFRSLKTVGTLRSLTVIIQTIAQSIPDMANIGFLLLIIMTVFAVAGVTLFGKEIPKHFGNIAAALYSLFICVTQDGWMDIMKDLKARNNFTLYYGGMAYFLIAITIGSLIFANLIVAVVVTNLEFAMKEMKKERRAQEDFLSKSEDDTDNELEHDYVPIMAAHRANYDANITHQHPLELVDFSHLTVEKLEHFFLILTAIEENLAEYNSIKEDLNQIIHVVKMFNLLDGWSADTTDTEMTEDVIKELSEVDLKKGDIISNLIKLEGRNILDSTKANNFLQLRKMGKFGAAKDAMSKRRISKTDVTSDSSS